jgi:hypothetical protein
MLEVSSSGMDAIAARFKTMRERIAKLRHDVPQEFFNWEAEEVHEKNPWVKRTGRKGSRVRNRHYYTVILPHSAREMARRKKAAMRMRRKHIVSRRRGTTKPTLRPELLHRWRDRLTLLLHDIRW